MIVSTGLYSLSLGQYPTIASSQQTLFHMHKFKYYSIHKQLDAQILSCETKAFLDTPAAPVHMKDLQIASIYQLYDFVAVIFYIRGKR